MILFACSLGLLCLGTYLCTVFRRKTWMFSDSEVWYWSWASTQTCPRAGEGNINKNLSYSFGITGSSSICRSSSAIVVNLFGIMWQLGILGLILVYLLPLKCLFRNCKVLARKKSFVLMCVFYTCFRGL